jgi:shikimate kinase
MLNKHIILIGFKHVGKSSVAKKLSVALTKKLIDLDNNIENTYVEKFGVALNCRYIVKNHGEEFFRNLESETLASIIHDVPSVIALGGGACLSPGNQKMLAGHTVIHITAEAPIVYDRIMHHGIPSFFPYDVDPQNYFMKLWSERQIEYQKIAHLSADNSFSLEHTVNTIINELRLCRR